MGKYTIKDIARECGVGVSTVSRAINNHPDINPQTKQLILDKISERQYIPNNSARNLKKTETNTIAVLIKGIANPIFHQMIDIIQSEILSKDYAFILKKVGFDEDETVVASEIIREQKIKGIVFLGGIFTHTEERLKELTVPYVLSTIEPNTSIDGNIYSAISVDDVAESCRMTEYLIENGHKRIAMLQAKKEDLGVGYLRLKGYQQAFKNHNIPMKRNLIIYSDSKSDGDLFSMENGYKLAKKLIASHKDFTAIFAISDRMAIGAIKALTEEGIRVPQDISVVGFDGLDIARYYIPSITTVKQPVEDMARETIYQLFRLIKGSGVNKHMVFEGTIVEGESTRAIKKRGS